MKKYKLEYRYRIYNPQQNRMYYPAENLTILNNGTNDPSINQKLVAGKKGWYDSDSIENIENVIFSQYLNIKDDHNNAIYNGDILDFRRNNGEKYNVIAQYGWVNQSPRYIGLYFQIIGSNEIINPVDFFDSYNDPDKHYTTKVIGNIYEDLELLKNNEN